MRILILGATSPIARAIASELCSGGNALLLAGRNLEEVERTAADLRLRKGGRVEAARLDAEEWSGHEGFLDSVRTRFGGIDGVVLAIGHLGRQPEESRDRDAALRIVDVNFRAAVSLLAPVANWMEEQGSGFIMGLSSVAADRARRSNYVYGASKAGFSAYLDGLHHRLGPRGVRVYDVKPGYVDTSMTYGKAGLFLVASPEGVGRAARRLLDRPGGVYYLPRVWRLIMFCVRVIPDFLFRRLDL